MVIGLDEQRDLLRSFVFAPRVVFGDDVVITLDRHGLVASGSSLNAAADAMLNELREYSQEFLTRYEFFRHTTRNQELPWLLRFALTPEETQRELLFEETQADQVQSVEGSAVAQ